MRALTSATNVDGATAAYPNGRTRDKLGAVPGTLSQEILNGDAQQFFQKLIIDAGITPNGDPDSALGGYQLIDALVKKITDTVGLRRIVAIGDWDMDATESVAVTHNVADFKKIRAISIIIRNDADDLYTELNSIGPISSTPDGAIEVYNATQIFLKRITSGHFDSTDFNATGYNRGFITIEYTD